MLDTPVLSMGEEVAPIYVDLASESDDPQVTVVPSLCMMCHNMGITRLLMTRIPHYKEIILTSFECNHCGNRNSGCQSGHVGECGVRYQLDVRELGDLTRQVVRSEHATVTVPELELEIPATSEKGEVTTVEGLLNQTKEGLSRDQEARRCDQPEVADQIDVFLARLTTCLTLASPFTLIVDDPSGNSFVENPLAPKLDKKITKKTYHRTPQQNTALGLAQEESVGRIEEEEEEEEGEGELRLEKPQGEDKVDTARIEKEVGKDLINEKEKEGKIVREEIGGYKEVEAKGEKIREEDEIKVKEKAGEGGNIKDEVLVFATLCDRCARPTTTNMKVVQIPYFKEVIIMALHCDGCGHRTNEVKSGAGVSDHGRRVTLALTHPSDLTRDVLKSDTCELSIPELELSVGGGLIGGKFTTVEGLLMNVRDDLASNPFLAGDTAQEQRKEVLNRLLQSLDKVIEGELNVTLVLDDPAGNSYVQNLYAPDPDPNMISEEYTRTPDQDDDLGLTHMRTENYMQEDFKVLKEAGAKAAA